MAFEELDPNQYQIVEEGAAAGVEELDPSLYEPVPEAANGLHPATPINKSPLKIEERFKAIGLSNERGKLKFLKERFEAVDKDADGNLVVKEGGLWHRVDADTLGDTDPWTATKAALKGTAALGLSAAGFSKQANKLVEGDAAATEFAGEVAENLPTAAAIGASALAGVATGGASLALQAAGAGVAAGAIELGRTSLGRLEGTYEATPEEQIKDVAFESLLNIGGVAVAAGVKPTAAFVADKLPWIANALKKAPKASRDIIKNFYGKLNVGADNIDELIENTQGVRSAMKRAATLAGGSDDEFVKVVARDNISAAREAANQGKVMLRELYTRMEDELVRAVPRGFSANIDEVTTGIYKEAMDQGLVTVFDGTGKELAPALAKRIMTNASSGKLPSGLKLGLRSKEALEGTFRRGGLDVGDAAMIDETYGALKEFFNSIGTVHGAKSLRGEYGVRQLMKVSQVLDDVTYKLTQEGLDQSVNSIPGLMTKFHDTVRTGVTNQFKKVGADSAFDAINKSYSSLKRPLNGLLQAARRADKTGMDTPLEQFISRLGARPGKSEAVKEGFEQALKVGEKYGLTSAKRFGEIQKKIRANQAAMAFNPWIKPGLIGQGSATAAIGSAVIGNPTMLGIAAGGAAVTSPRVAYGVTLMSKSLWQGKDFLTKLGAQGAERLLQNPAALNAFVSTMAQVPQLQEQTTQQLMTPLAGGQ